MILYLDRFHFVSIFWQDLLKDQKTTLLRRKKMEEIFHPIRLSEHQKHGYSRTKSSDPKCCLWRCVYLITGVPAKYLHILGWKDLETCPVPLLMLLNKKWWCACVHKRILNKEAALDDSWLCQECLETHLSKDWIHLDITRLWFCSMGSHPPFVQVLCGSAPENALIKQC